MQELTRMILTRAKDPEETRKMMVTYQTKVKDAEDNNRYLDEEFLKTVLSGFIDPTTRIGTVQCQKKGFPLDEFERKILEFINVVAAQSMQTTSSKGATPMQIGAFGNQSYSDAAESYDARGDARGDIQCEND